MDPCAPESFVDVDVAHSGKGALVQERGLHRSAAARETCAQLGRREAIGQRLRAKARVEVGIELVRLQHEPGAEASDVAIRNVRSVV